MYPVPVRGKHPCLPASISIPGGSLHPSASSSQHAPSLPFPGLPQPLLWAFSSGLAPRVLIRLVLVTQPQACGGSHNPRHLSLGKMTQGGGCPGVGVCLLSSSFRHSGCGYLSLREWGRKCWGTGPSCLPFFVGSSRATWLPRCHGPPRTSCE